MEAGCGENILQCVQKTSDYQNTFDKYLNIAFTMFTAIFQQPECLATFWNTLVTFFIQKSIQKFLKGNDYALIIC